MANEVEVIRAEIVRPDASQSWGFRLRGGTDFGEPIRITKVTPGGPADGAGLQTDDEVMQIEGRSALDLRHSQVLDILGQLTTNRIRITLRRKFGSSSYVQHPSLYWPKTVDLSNPGEYKQHGPQRTSFEFKTVQSRPFVESTPRRRQVNPQSSAMSHCRSSSSPEASGGAETVSSAAESVPAVSYYKNEYSAPLMHDTSPADNEIPQSRTFRMLQSIMENDEPAAGAAGLPPPRSAAVERMKREAASSGSGSSPPRVKVLMAQKYNSPLGIYSPNNAIETFAAQAETAIEALEKQQQPSLTEYKPVHVTLN